MLHRQEDNRAYTNTILHMQLPWPLGNCIHCWRCEPNFTTRVPGACNNNPDRLLNCSTTQCYIYDALQYVLVNDCVQLMSSFKSVEVKGSWGHYKQMPCGPDDLICQHVSKQKQVACAWIQTQPMMACVLWPSKIAFDLLCNHVQ